jgi:exopolysaccharide biosynthesis polyprenyl glycosylphosphotransferase
VSRPEIQSVRQNTNQVKMSANTAEAIPGRAPALPEEVVPPPHLVETPAIRRDPRVDSAYPRLLALSDTIAIVLGLVFTIASLHLFGREIDLVRSGVTALLVLPVWFLVAYTAGLYSLAELRISHSVIDEIGKVAIAVTAWSWMLLVCKSVFSVFPTSLIGPTVLWLLVIAMVLSGRTIARQIARHRLWRPNRIAIVGWPTETDVVRDRVDRHPEWGLEVEAEFEFGSDDVAGLDGLADRLGALEIDRVMIVGGTEGLIDRNRLVSLLVERGLMVDLVSGGAESLYSNSVLHDLEGLPVMSVRSSRLRPLDLRVKRLFDIAVSGSALMVVSPVLLWAAIRIKLDSPGPALFRQVRCGFEGRPFKVVKFRTMVDGAHDMREELWRESEDERNGDVLFKLEDDPRLTDLGRGLRKWSIDELPQLWNVLKGEMSIVGPRPLTFEEADQATGQYRLRTSVKPGLAGPWQAHGRSTIPFEDMIRLDYSYAVGWSMAEDLKLLLRTVNAVFGRRGAY